MRTFQIILDVLIVAADMALIVTLLRRWKR